MFLNYCILNIFDYICAQNAQCWARITKSDMEIQRYNRLKAANERVQSEACFNSAEQSKQREPSEPSMLAWVWSSRVRGRRSQHEQARPRVKIVLAEKERTDTWLSEKMSQNIYTISRWTTNHSAIWDECQSKKVQPSVETLGLWILATIGTNSTRLRVT